MAQPKPINDRRSVEAALARFLERQMSRSLGIISWMRDAAQWRNPNDRGVKAVGNFHAQLNAKRCEEHAADIARRALAHVQRIRQLDASRRASAIADYHAQQRRPAHTDPTANPLISLARQAATQSKPLFRDQNCREIARFVASPFITERTEKAA